MANRKMQERHINGRRKCNVVVVVVDMADVADIADVSDHVADDVADVAVVIFNDQQNI